MKRIIDQIEDSLVQKPNPKELPEFISTGCIPLNLAASQRGHDGGWARGRITNLVGDNSSGKTILALESMFSAYKLIQIGSESKTFPKIKKVNFVYNNAEGVMDFDVRSMYGRKFYDAVEWIQTNVCQDFGKDYERRVMELDEGDFLFYVIDSIDSTISQEQVDRITKSIKSDKIEEGSYNTEKAKYFSNSFFNYLCMLMSGQDPEKKKSLNKAKDATLLCISQVRENLNAGIFGKKFYRTGGKAMDFYCHQVCWLYLMEKMKIVRKGQEKVYGVKIKSKFEKNKVAKPYRESDFRILFDYGIDNIESMIDYVYGPKKHEIEIDGEAYKRMDFIHLCEEDQDIYNILVNDTVELWNDIESATIPNRKRRYEEE